MAVCPTCASPLEGDEIYCLHCGRRLVPEERPPPSFGVPAFIVAAIALLAIAGLVFALQQVESDAEKTATRDVPVVEPPTPETDDDKPTDVEAWPAGASAYTVVLMATDDEAEARSEATAAVAAGAPAGVLDSNAYPSLEPGRWVVFVGSFDSRELAARVAERYAAAGFPEAVPGFVSDQREPEG